MGKIMRSLTGAPSPAKMARQQQEAFDRQIAAQRQMQQEAEQRAEERRQEEENRALARAASEIRSRMAVTQGRRANRVALNARAVLNEMGLLG